MHSSNSTDRDRNWVHGSLQGLRADELGELFNFRQDAINRVRADAGTMRLNGLEYYSLLSIGERTTRWGKFYSDSREAYTDEQHVVIVRGEDLFDFDGVNDHDAEEEGK